MNSTNPSCVDLVAFSDGELDEARAHAFRDHLAGCEACQRGLVEEMDLSARLSTLTPKLPDQRPHHDERSTRPRWAVGKGRIAALVGTLSTTAAAVALLHGGSSGVANAFASQSTRPFEFRLAYHDAAAYRPLRGQMLGADGPAGPRIEYTALAELEKRGDHHGVAIARAWNRENPGGIVDELGKLPATPAIQSDRAALALLTTSDDNLEPILAELEELRRSSDPTVTRAARWNYAVALSRLALPLSAANEFRAIADDHEPGWAKEAEQRATEQRGLGENAEQAWNAARQAGDALLSSGVPVPVAIIDRVPGMLRAYLYNAVRTAPNRERVQALLPMASQLDQHSDKPVLAAYVKRIAALDFARRAPLAKAYAAVLQKQPVPPELAAAIRKVDQWGARSFSRRGNAAAGLQDAAKPPADIAEIADVVMGALVQLDAVPKHLEVFDQLVEYSDDPWFAMVHDVAVATAAIDRRDWLEAETRLRGAQKRCSRGIEYQCLSITYQLGRLYQSLHRVPAAVATLRKGLADADGAAEWAKRRDFMKRLADVERHNTSPASCRAYAHEVLNAEAEGSDYFRAAQRILVGAALLDGDGKAARAALSFAPPQTGDHKWEAANYLADIGRLDPQLGDLAQLRSWLASWHGELANRGALTEVHRLLAAQAEGRLQIESDRAAGTATLQRAIEMASQLPNEVDAQRARTGAYSVLVLDAARHGEYTQAIALVAQELELPVPTPCTVAMVADDERAVIVVRGSTGQDHGDYVARRRPRDGALTVSKERALELADCRHVWVMAQAALQGQPRILPASLPWSYLASATGGSAHGAQRAVKLPSEAATLVVANVTPPDKLQLPPLSVGALPPHGATTVVLSGRAATPARVLAEMRNARVIRFHTHALLDAGISDASYLVLSDDHGQFQLTAEAIRGISLNGRPIVVLAACNAAQGARYQHAPWSLPDAFLAVGARAVFAAGAAIPDLEAEPFFGRVLGRIADGAEPAVALRDERVAALARDAASWTASVMLFE